MAIAARLLRGLTAIVVLAALLVGVPSLLAQAVGWPLPRAIPAWGDFRATFTGDVPLDAATVWKVLATVVWIAWAQLVAAAAVEAAALARGGLATPVRGFAHMQGLAGPLLSAAALLLPSSLAHPGGTPTQPAPALARTLLVAHLDVPSVRPSVTDPPEREAAQSPEATTFDHTVQRRDTLWDLAERHVAPGGSTEEIAAGVGRIFELNAGQPQPDGATLSDAGIIRPGWVLRIPATDATTPLATGVDAVTVVPGDSLWEIAETHLGDGHRYRELYDLNAGDPQPDGRTLSDPSTIRPGWLIELHPSPAPPPAPTSEAGPPTPPAPPTENEPLAAETSGRSHDAAVPTLEDGPPTAGGAVADDADEEAPVGALGVAGGVLSAGLLAAVAVRRQRRRAQRRPGTELPPLPAAAAPIVDAVADADTDLHTATDRALRRLATALADRPTVPVPIVATLHAADLELLLDRVDQAPPEGWTPVADGLVWRTSLTAYDAPEAGPGWLPALVSIGALDDGGLLLNLEAAGAVALTGPADSVTALALSIAVELGVTPLADLPAVHVVGDALGTVRIDALPGIRHHDYLRHALAVADDSAAVIADALSAAGAETVFELRCRAADEAWAPAVVIVSAREDPDDLSRLLALSASRTGVVAVIVGAAAPGALELAVTADTVTVPGLGLSCTPQRLDTAGIDAITALLDAADAPCGPPAEPDSPLTLFDDAGPETADPEPRLFLRLLGPITFEGADLRPQQLALLAYLVLHPGATADAVREAVWGGKAPTRERFLNTIHELRRAVGADVLPASTDGRYRLRSVWCDAHELQRLTATAAGPGGDATVDLRAALELVSGPPLTYETRHRRHFRWVDLGNHASRWERIAGDAAHELATNALDAGDVDLARWAAERGLAAAPADETLTCDLVSAHLAAGDRNTAEHVAEAYTRVLDDLGIDESPEALVALLDSRRAS